MSREPYRSAPRVFWIMDKWLFASGQACIRRIQKEWNNVVVVHTPVHASWLDQVEIYFSVLQRKVLTPSTFTSIEEGKDRILQFQEYYEQAAKPFQWRFTQRDPLKLLKKLETAKPQMVAAA